MIFSLLDYRKYRHLTGRYSRNYRNFMGGAFQGYVPEDKIKTLSTGDSIYVQTLGSRLSWLIMYLSSSEVSHFASYVGDGNILHATTNAGAVIEPIESLFNENTRILIFHREISDRERLQISINQMNLMGAPYGWMPVFIKGYQILSGRDWIYFRWKFAIDIALILFALDIPVILALHYPVISWLIPAYLVVIGFHSLLWEFYPLNRKGVNIKPNDAINLALSTKGSFIYDEDFISKQIEDELAVLRDYAEKRRIATKAIVEVEKKTPR